MEEGSAGQGTIPDHQPFFCEENIWRLCRLSGLDGPSSRVLIVTNERKTLPMLCQQAAAPDDVVWWDYHVVHLDLGPPARILDLDSRLSSVGRPVPAPMWLDSSFPTGRLPQDLEPRFRVIPAAEYVRRFWSDRSHMRASDGSWLEPPPPWPPPQAPVEVWPISLQRYLDLDDPEPGPWLDRSGLKVLMEG